MGHLLVRYGFFRHFFQCIYPAVTYTVGKLFFLSPYYFMRQHIFERFAEYFFLDHLAGGHFGLRVQPHCRVHELLVQKGHASFDTPCRQALVRPKAIVQVQFAYLAQRFLVERFGIGGFVEIQVSAEYFVGPLAR